MHGPKTASVQKEFPLKDSKAAAFLKTGSKREYERRINIYRERVGEGEYSDKYFCFEIRIFSGEHNLT